MLSYYFNNVYSIDDIYLVTYEKSCYMYGFEVKITQQETMSRQTLNDRLRYDRNFNITKVEKINNNCVFYY